MPTGADKRQTDKLCIKNKQAKFDALFQNDVREFRGFKDFSSTVYYTVIPSFNNISNKM